MDHGQVALVVRVAQVRIEIRQLIFGQHAFVDHDFRRQAADEEILGLAQFVAAAQPVAGLLADQIKLALERVAGQPVGRADEQLFDDRLRQPGRLAEIGFFRAHRDFAPADQRLAFGCTNLRNRPLAGLALRVVGRQEHVPGRIATRFRQFGVESLDRRLRQKLVGQRGQDAAAVAGIRLRAAGAAMLHPAQQMVRIPDDLVAALPLDMRNEADAAAVVLVFRAIKSFGARSQGGLRVRFSAFWSHGFPWRGPAFPRSIIFRCCVVQVAGESAGARACQEHSLPWRRGLFGAGAVLGRVWTIRNG